MTLTEREIDSDRETEREGDLIRGSNSQIFEGKQVIVMLWVCYREVTDPIVSFRSERTSIPIPIPME